MSGFAQNGNVDSTYRLQIIVDGITEFGPTDMLKIIIDDKKGYENWFSVPHLLYYWRPVSDYTMETTVFGVKKGEYMVFVNVSDSTQDYFAFEHDQIGFSRINDKKTLLRYKKKCNNVGMIYPPFDSVKFSIPETKVMRIILCNPKEGIDLTIE